MVTTESRADLLVFKHRAESRAKSNEGDWFFVEYASRTDKKICFVTTESRADLKICYVTTESRAGWRNSAKKGLME